MFSSFKKKSSSRSNNRRQNPNPITDTNLPIFNSHLPNINIRFSRAKNSFTQDQMSLLGTSTHRAIYLIDEIKTSANNLFSDDLDKLEYWLGNIKTDMGLIEAHKNLYNLHHILHDDTKTIKYVRRKRNKHLAFTADEICASCKRVNDITDPTDPTDGNPRYSRRYLTASKQLCDDFNVGIIGPHVNCPDRLRVDTTRAREYVTGAVSNAQGIEQQEEQEVLYVRNVAYQINIDDDMFSNNTTVSQQIQIILHQMCRHANGINDVYAQEGIGNNIPRELDCLFYAEFAPDIAKLNAGNWSLLYSNWNTPVLQQDWQFRGTLQVVKLKVNPRKEYYATDENELEAFVSGPPPKAEYEPSKWYSDTSTCACCHKVYSK
ncbi:MAG: hypothetical protein KAH18_10695 [Psychromonas sp.]|nr:hypothetical protein [Psychromonas sp.]